jgi:hypothetical protein
MPSNGFSRAKMSGVENPAGWLTTVVARICLLRAQIAALTRRIATPMNSRGRI